MYFTQLRTAIIGELSRGWQRVPMPYAPIPVGEPLRWTGGSRLKASGVAYRREYGTARDLRCVRTIVHNAPYETANLNPSVLTFNIEFAKITNANAEITNANVKIANAFAEITNANAEITNEFAEITNANVKITNEFAEITNANVKITNANVKIANANAEITNANAEITNAIAEITNAIAMIAISSGVTRFFRLVCTP